MLLTQTATDLWALKPAVPATSGLQFGSLVYDSLGELEVTFNATLVSLVEEAKKIVLTVNLPIDALKQFRAIEATLAEIRGNFRQFFLVYNGTARIKLDYKDGALTTSANFLYEDIPNLPSGAALRITGKLGYYFDNENARTGIFFKTTDIRVGK